jgi:hypothetical protein
VIEFKDKVVDDTYSDLLARERDLEEDLADIQEQMSELIANNEQE